MVAWDNLLGVLVVFLARDAILRGRSVAAADLRMAAEANMMDQSFDFRQGKAG